ncbi:MFS transporter [Sporobolomyces koalae]|uniref:MFS transporter n=1 Tax=Sporobolomyces koalae TaxID=500713 RepID=UPI0031826086
MTSTTGTTPNASSTSTLAEQVNVERQSGFKQPPLVPAESSKATVQQLPRTQDFGFLPIPRRCRQSAEPFRFTLALNLLLSATSCFTVANIYYPQPILVQLAEQFNVTYDEITLVPSLLQAGYLVGLLLLTPLGDLVPRRPLLLALVFLTSTLSLGQATVTSFAGFKALAFVVGLFTVTPQVVNPLTADSAPPARRYAAVSITVAGLLAGMVVGRVFAGIVTRFSGQPHYTFYLASGTQYVLLATLYWFLPDFPKKSTGLSYFGILKSMVTIFLTKPVLIQACLIGFCMTAIMVSWWTTLTFLLSASPFSYDTFEIGLFGLTGIVAIFSVPWVGKLTDRLNPWVVCLLALSGQTLIAVMCLGSAGLSLAPVIIACICVDIFHQSNTIGQQGRIYSIDPLSRGRINGVYMAFVFAGQATGSAAGPKLFLRYGWRAPYGLHVALGVTALFLLFARGPRAQGWVGWSGQYTLAKETTSLPAETKKDPERGDELQHRTEEEIESKTLNQDTSEIDTTVLKV